MMMLEHVTISLKAARAHSLRTTIITISRHIIIAFHAASGILLDALGLISYFYFVIISVFLARSFSYGVPQTAQ